MLKYKIDVLKALKEKGITQTTIRKENLLSQYAVSKMRKGELIGMVELEKVCRLLSLQPGDIIEFVEQ